MMKVKKVSTAALNSWVDEMLKASKVVGIQADGDRFAFKPLDKASDLRLDYDISKLAPKSFFQPQCETMLSFEKDKGYSSSFSVEPLVLLGVHPYDMAAILQMDEIFSQDNYDVYYMKRRENSTIVVVDLENVAPNSFAGHMGTAHIEKGYDVLLTKVGGDYLVQSGSDKGTALMAGLAKEADADDKQIASRADVWAKNEAAARKHKLTADSSKWPGILEKSYDNPIWEEKSEKCFSCGSCTLVCPTCYCFDVKEEVDWSLGKGKRERTWDSCMLVDFATVAGNHNFRKKAGDRFRHRYYRKGKYVPSKIGGRIACVGCGRCITACVANIANPVEIFNTLGEGK